MPSAASRYREDAPLDMRMDQRANPKTAGRHREYLQRSRAVPDDSVTMEKTSLRRILPNISAGPEQEAPVRTTGELTEIIKERPIPMKVRATGGHPAKKNVPGDSGLS
ncbi:MAG: 16S rRNA (cytosine(1402)-N(4))-methyltransferase [Lachnospiraceae bacterium]